MTEDALPAALVGLPEPWNLTSDRARRAALATRKAPEAPLVLDRVLGVLPTLQAARPPDEALPEGLAEYFDFTAHGLAEQLPTLDEVSHGALAAVLRNWSATEPDPRQVAALCARWLASIGWHLVDSALHAVDGADAIDAAVAVVRRHLMRLHPRTGTLVLGTLALQAQHRAAGLLTEVAADPHHDAMMRQQATHYLRWLEDLPRPRRWGWLKLPW